MGHKFDFNEEYQLKILKYVVTDKSGWKSLTHIKWQYFELLDHQVIARSILKYFKQYNKVPRDASTLLEVLKKVYTYRDYAESLTDKDRKRVSTIVKKKLYSGVVRDTESVIDSIKNFASYIEFNNVLETVDVNDFESYSKYIKNFQKAINTGKDLTQNLGLQMLSNVEGRIALRRNQINDITPTPFEGINKSTNAGGYGKGSIVVVIDKPKAGKTLTLINLAVGHLKKVQMGAGLIKGTNKGIVTRNKRIIYFDLENGEENLSCRVDQCIVGATKKEILSGSKDKQLRNRYRQWKKLGGELWIKRVPARSTANDLQTFIDEVKEEHGIEFDIAVIDYVGLMGCLSGKTEDEPRISEAYIDVKNWADKNQLDVVYTGHHVTRQGYKNRPTRHDPIFLAKCIEIERHVDVILGIQQSKDEQERGWLRLEVITQRDGHQYGRALFKVDMAHQRLREFNQQSYEAYYNRARDFLAEFDPELAGQTSNGTIKKEKTESLDSKYKKQAKSKMI